MLLCPSSVREFVSSPLASAGRTAARAPSTSAFLAALCPARPANSPHEPFEVGRCAAKWREVMTFTPLHPTPAAPFMTFAAPRMTPAAVVMTFAAPVMAPVAVVMTLAAPFVTLAAVVMTFTSPQATFAAPRTSSAAL